MTTAQDEAIKALRKVSKSLDQMIRDDLAGIKFELERIEDLLRPGRKFTPAEFIEGGRTMELENQDLGAK